MADYTHVQKSNSTGWIIGAIVVVLVVLFIAFAGGGPGTISDDGAVGPDGTPIVAPATDPEPAPAATE